MNFLSRIVSVGIVGIALFLVASLTDAQAATCDTQYLGNRLHACYYSWGGGDESKVPTNAAEVLNQENFAIPENVGAYQMFDYRPGWAQGIGNSGRAFSVSGIWRGKVKFQAGTYTFHTISDDGVELVVDGGRKFINWTDHGDTQNDVQVIFPDPGWHDIQLKWYQGGGGARLKFWWDFQPLPQCDTQYLGNRLHTCFYSWNGGNESAVPTGAVGTIGQEDFAIPENVGSYQVFDFNGGWVWNNGWVPQNIRNSGRPFSVSGIWRGKVKFQAGTYTFRTLSDDGVELLVDGKQQFINWTDHGDTWNSASMTFFEPGWHDIQLKWYQGGGGARLLFRWDYQSTTCDTSFNQSNLHACFFNWTGGNENAVPTNAAVVIGQRDVSIPESTEAYTVFDYVGGNWEWKCRLFENSWCRWEQKEIEGSGKPFQVSAVWRGKVKLKAGTYDFHTISDDGVELIIDGGRKFINWSDHGDTQNDATAAFNDAGWHDIQLKWFQGGGGARLKFWWDNYKPPCDTTFKNDTLHACFYPWSGGDRNAVPTASLPVLGQKDEQSIPRGGGSFTAFEYRPGGGQNIGNSGRAFQVSGIWRGRPYFKKGRYIFHTISDDGVEVSVDDKEMIGNWSDHGDVENTGELWLDEGYHAVQVKWYQGGGGARLKFWWEWVNTPPELTIVEPQGSYIAVNPRDPARQVFFYAKTSDPDTGRDPSVMFTIQDTSKNNLLRATVQSPNSNGMSGSADSRMVGKLQYHYYAPDSNALSSGGRSALRFTGKGAEMDVRKPGVYTFIASATDVDGGVTEKTTTVTVNETPIIQRVSDSNPIYVKRKTDTASVTVEADATDSDDGISSVTIQKDSDAPVAATRVGSTNTYRATFSLGVRDAAYAFTVRATDANPIKQETVRNTQGITITVRKENEPPAKPSFSIPGVPAGQRTFFLPKDKDLFYVPVSNLTDPDDNISTVSLFVDGQEVYTKNGSEIRDGKVLLQWNNPTDGRHTVNVRVTDFGGPKSFTVDGDTVTIENNITPEVSFIRNQRTPIELQRERQGRPALLYPYGENVRILASAADADGITSVQFFEGNTLLSTVEKGGFGGNASTYAFIWKGEKEPGRHVIRIVANDTRGGFASPSDTYVFDVENPPIIDAFTIEGISAQTQTVTRPATITLVTYVYDPDSPQPNLSLFRDSTEYGISPTISKKSTPKGRDGYEYRYVIQAKELGTFAFTVQASDGTNKSPISTPLKITVKNADPTATLIEPKKTLTTDTRIQMYADAADADGSLPVVTFFVYDSKNNVVFRSLSQSPTYIPSNSSNARMADVKKRYYAPIGSSAAIGRSTFGAGENQPGYIRFPQPGIYTIGVVASDVDGGFSSDTRKEIIINDIPVIEAFSVKEGPVVMALNGKATIQLEARARDLVGGIANVNFSNESNQTIGGVRGPLGDGMYRITVTLDARDRPYTFYTWPTDLHGEGGRPAALMVKIMAQPRVYPSAISPAPQATDGAYYVVPDDTPRFGFESIIDNNVSPMSVEFFSGSEKLRTRAYQNDPLVFEWVDPPYGRREIRAKLSNENGITVETNPIPVTIYDKLQLYDRRSNASSGAAPYIYAMTSKTPKNGLVVLAQGQSSGAVPLNVKVRSKGSRVRAVRVFEQGKESGGSTVSIPSADREPKKELSLDFSFDGVAEGPHHFIAKVMDETGEVSANKEIVVVVAPFQDTKRVKEYETLYGLSYPSVIQIVPSESRDILKEGKKSGVGSARPAVLPSQGKLTPILKASEKQGAGAQSTQQKEGIIKTVWRSILNFFRR